MVTGQIVDTDHQHEDGQAVRPCRLRGPVALEAMELPRGGNHLWHDLKLVPAGADALAGVLPVLLVGGTVLAVAQGRGDGGRYCGGRGDFASASRR
jgi:hypothetical protein